MVFKPGNNKIQSQKRTRILLKIDLDMIAKAKNVSKRTVQRSIKSGKLNPDDLKSIAHYILQ